MTFTLTRATGAGLWVALGIVVVVGILLIFGLMHLPTRTRRPLMTAVVFLSGLYFALEFFLPTREVPQPGGGVAQENLLTPYVPTVVSPFAQILGGLLLGLGLFSLGRIHSNNLVKMRQGWVNSLALIISAIVMAVIGLWSRANQEHSPAIDQVFSHLFNGLFQNMDAAMFSLISFYILSAAYRAFRIRSVEASILMASALIVLLGLSFGGLITGSIPNQGMAANLRIETWGQWILNTLSTPAFRAIDFGVGLGGLAMGLRLWLGIERGALFGD